MGRHDISIVIDGERVRALEDAIDLFRARRPLDPDHPPKVTIQDVINYHEELDKSVI